jgi:hypothetical protein
MKNDIPPFFVWYIFIFHIFQKTKMGGSQSSSVREIVKELESAIGKYQEEISALHQEIFGK